MARGHEGELFVDRCYSQVTPGQITELEISTPRSHGLGGSAAGQAHGYTWNGGAVSLFNGAANDDTILNAEVRDLIAIGSIHFDRTWLDCPAFGRRRDP